jgi:hypothetical protein
MAGVNVGHSRSQFTHGKRGAFVPIVKRFVCLANSRKLSGRCIAGKELVSSKAVGWVRPVSNREHEEVSEYERQFQDGSDPRVLDVIDVPLLQPMPKTYQPENWQLDPQHYWVKAGTFLWTDLRNLIDPVLPLWTNGHSTHMGMNDKIPLSIVTTLSNSLRLIQVSEMTLHVSITGEAFGNPKRRVQGRFSHNGIMHWLWVTDPVYEKAYLLKSDGEYRIGECYLTISVGEPFNDAYFKLIAAIMEPDGG